MERPGMSQVSAAEARESRGAFRDLFVTMRETFQPPVIEIRRRDEDTGEFATRATFQPATLSLPKRQEQVSGANAGMVATQRDGRFTVEGDAADIQRDDVFQIDGQRAVVTNVDPVANEIGYRSVDFRVEG